MTDGSGLAAWLLAATNFKDDVRRGAITKQQAADIIDTLLLGLEEWTNGSATMDARQIQIARNLLQGLLEGLGKPDSQL